MVLSAMSDGDLADEEIVAIANLAREIPQFARMGDEQLETLLTSSLERIEKLGDFDAALADIARRAQGANEEQRTLAFTFALAVQYADDEVSEEEDALLEHLREALALSPEQAQGLIDAFEAGEEA
jgi:tellurite resistance protein